MAEQHCDDGPAYVCPVCPADKDGNFFRIIRAFKKHMNSFHSELRGTDLSEFAVPKQL